MAEPTVSSADATNFPAPDGTEVTVDKPSGLTENVYPILLLNGYTYWPLSYHNNRFSFAIVVTNTTNNVTESNIISTIEAPGARYIASIQINTTKHEVNFVGQNGEVATLSFDALSVFPGSATVSTADATNFPAPGGTKVTSDPDSGLTENDYPILLLNGYTYWPLSYHDNRFSFAIIVTNTTNNVTESNIISTIEAPGARYIASIQVNTTKHKVNFVSQSGEVATLSFDALSVSLGSTCE
jgi:hypothetical protein